MSNNQKQAEKELQKQAEQVKKSSGKRYVVKFDHDKVIYVIQAKDERTGKTGEKKVPKGTPNAVEKIIKDKREQLRLAVGRGRIVTLIKGEEITKEEFDLIGEIAQKAYINIK